MARTKGRFLRRLKWSLDCMVPAGESREVLEDYTAFFDEKLAEGKSEAEVCKEFGRPWHVARTILREDGRDGRPLAMLLPLFAAAGAWANWWYTWRYGFFRSRTLLLCVIEALLVPLLWLFWRKRVYPAALPGKGSFAVVCAVPLALWGSYLAYVLYLLGKPTEWWTWLGENSCTLSAIGQSTGTLGVYLQMAVLAVFVLCLVWGWTKTPWYLVPAAHALAGNAALSSIMKTLTSMDLYMADYIAWTVRSVRQSAYIYGAAALGGAALTALLVWIGGRHGRTA